MKIIVLQQDLLPNLQAVSRSIGAKNLPVLSNVLIQADGKKVRLSATNLELGVIKEVEAEVLEEGSLTVPARTLIEVIQPLSGEKLELEGVGEQLKISTKNFSGSLNGIAASEFPQIPLSSDQSVSVDAKLLHSSLPEITFAAAADEGRPVLTGILTEIKKDSLELVATDGFRLAHKRIIMNNSVASSSLKTDKAETINNTNFRSLIPRKTFEEVSRLISEDTSSEEKIEISTSENQNQMVFKIGQTLVSSRLIEGQFPTWEKIVPTQFIAKVIVDRPELIKAVKLASVFARSEANIVKIETEKDKLVFTSAAKQLGEQKMDIEAKIEGESVTIAFNSKYLLDALNACSSEQVSIEFSGNLTPALIKPIGEQDLEYVVMPIRLS